MDPAECLRIADQCISDLDYESARFHLDNYRRWRAVGGFEPMEIAGSHQHGDLFARKCRDRLQSAENASIQYTRGEWAAEEGPNNTTSIVQCVVIASMPNWPVQSAEQAGNRSLILASGRMFELLRKQQQNFDEITAPDKFLDVEDLRNQIIDARDEMRALVRRIIKEANT